MLEDKDYRLLQLISEGFQPLSRERLDVAYLIARGLVEDDGGKVVLTDEGRRAVGVWSGV